jgi:hypothetical protein
MRKSVGSAERRRRRMKAGIHLSLDGRGRADRRSAG